MKPLISFLGKKSLFLFMREISLNSKRSEIYYWNEETVDMALDIAFLSIINLFLLAN